MGSPFSYYRKKATKGRFRLQIIILRGEAGASWEKLSSSFLKPFGPQKGPLLPLFGRPVEITPSFDVFVLCTMGDSAKDKFIKV